MENWNPRSPSKPSLVDDGMIAALKAHFDNWVADLITSNQARQTTDPNYIDFSCATKEHVAPKASRQTSDLIREVLRLRRLRDDLFPGGLFADPVWDLLLDLYKAGHEHRRISVSSACIASHTPPTTALRHIRIMEQAGMIKRIPDPHDSRRIFLELTPSAQAGMARWIASMDALVTERTRANAN